MTTQEIQGLLDLGANPNWKPRIGFTVLEHAIIRYGNGEAVDLIAKRVAANNAFWVAAGIGDVKTMLQFVNKQCVPNEAARQDRPDAGLLGTGGTVRPDASDVEVVWEAFTMAALNGRTNSMKAWRDQQSPRDLSSTQQHHLSTDASAQQVHALILTSGKKLS